MKDYEEIKKHILGTEYGKCERCGIFGKVNNGLCEHCYKEMKALYEENV